MEIIYILVHFFATTFIFNLYSQQLAHIVRICKKYKTQTRMITKSMGYHGKYHTKYN